LGSVPLESDTIAKRAPFSSKFMSNPNKLCQTAPANPTALILPGAGIQSTYDQPGDQVMAIADSLPALGIGARERLGVPMPHTRSVFACTKLLDRVSPGA
jgi:hypothetical protein